MLVQLKPTGKLNFEKLTANASKALASAQRELGRDIAKVARKAVLDDVKRSRRGGLRMGKRPDGGSFRLGARAIIEPSGTGVSVLLRARPAGFWSIVESGSAGHEVVPVGKRGALHFDGIYAAHADHPGTHGTPYWDRAEDALDRALTPVIEEAIDEAMLEV